MLNHFGLSKLLNKVVHPDQCLSLLIYHSSLVKTDRSHFAGQASGRQLLPHRFSCVVLLNHSGLVTPSSLSLSCTHRPTAPILELGIEGRSVASVNLGKSTLGKSQVLSDGFGG